MYNTTEEKIRAMEMSLEDKVEFSKSIIREWHKHWDGNVFVAFSGGKDSTILLHLARSVFPEIKGVFSNTGLEYPEIISFARSHDNIEVVQPKKKFIKVLEEDGFPVTNKQQARKIVRLQKATKNNFASRRLSLTGYSTSKKTYNRKSRVSNKWMPLAFSDVKITDACCDHLKKDPLKKWKKDNDKFKAFTGLMMGEGSSRDLALGMRPCNMFDSGDPTSVPLKFWTDEDVYKYAEQFNVEICSVYKDYNLKRTGCTFCAYGAEMEDENNNRFTKLKDSHPKQFGIFVHKYGMNKALDYAGINYGETPTYEKPPMPTYVCSSCSNTYETSHIGFITEREWTEQEEIDKNPTAGMNIYCEFCATNKGMDVYKTTKIELGNI
jgi:3'-phosphoadenosine 5'-phosphosulfate sulfotransferase (PAPS reductase)/FAD synthetase